MYLGIEIGGTKLQVGVGRGDGSPLVGLARMKVDPEEGAAGIRAQLEAAATELIAAHRPEAIGIGFGGPLLAIEGRTLTSHHIDGWDNFPLAKWCRETFELPTAIENDADTAGLGEALFGAGRGASPLVYVTVGTGIGGGLIIDGQIYHGIGRGALELGHLRPGLEAAAPHVTLESIASGTGIANQARRRIANNDNYAACDLLIRCDGDAAQMSARHVVEAAHAQNPLAVDIFDRACRGIGWALGQVITLVAPKRIVIGGGVSLAGDEAFFDPVRQYTQTYVFPPFAGTYDIVPAALGEEVVVHGALAVAKTAKMPPR